MRKPLVALIFVGVLALASTGQASQAGVNIAYPLDGGLMRISPANPTLPISFTVTCTDLEDHNVEWGYGAGSSGESLGKAKFRGTISIQFLQKFSEGEWSVWVSSECGKDKISFKVMP